MYYVHGGGGEEEERREGISEGGRKWHGNFTIYSYCLGKHNQNTFFLYTKPICVSIFDIYYGTFVALIKIKFELEPLHSFTFTIYVHILQKEWFTTCGEHRIFVVLLSRE